MAAAPIIFTVPGEAKAWARAGSNGGRKYTPKPQVAFAALVKLAGEAAMAGRPPLDRQCEVYVVVRKPVPASASRPAKAAMLAGGLRPAVRPDADNYAKLIGDALNGICWRDDALITDLHVLKRYAEIPGVHVTIVPHAGAGPEL